MRHLHRLCPVAAAIALAFHATAGAQTTEDLAVQLRQLREELQQVRSELDTLKQRSAAQPLAGAATTAPAGSGWDAAPTRAATAEAGASSTATGQAAPGDPGSRMSLFGYGEITYSRPHNDASGASANVRRGVLGWAYRFDDRTRLAAELEIENAVVSSSDHGEAALEQFYIEHDLRSDLTARAGLFLMPVGYINEVHEPTRFYGVNRNLVETAIIPSTWRELGVGLRGTTDFGLRWDAGAVTSFDLTKWDATSQDGRESPLGSIHQEGQLAKARNIGLYGAVNYNGIPGFNVGASVFAGGVGQKQAGFAAPDAKVALSEVHARWQPGKWDLSALAAFGRFSNVEELNATFAGQPTPVPERFSGWYAQAAYRLWQSGDYALAPFVRYERLNTAKSIAGLAPGLGPEIEPDTRVWTVGASFYLNPQVVFKADYQKFRNNSALDRFNLGLGFHF
jgi:hypothetical protein